MKNPLRSLCVFCGSSSGSQPLYKDAAESMGRILVKNKIRLVFGGGNVGLMGAIADTVLAEGGEVIGVIPEALANKEVVHRDLAHRQVTKLHVVASMHERKALMADLSDGFIALPGGFGTIEEFCEVLTWAQLGFHQKPCGLLNTAGFYDSLLGMVSHATKEQFIDSRHESLILHAAQPEELISKFFEFEPISVPKWATRSD